MILFDFSLFFLFHFLNIFLHKDNILLWLAACELALLNILLLYISGSLSWDDLNGLIIFLFILVVVGSESGVALAVCVLTYKFRSSLNLTEQIFLKG